MSEIQTDKSADPVESSPATAEDAPAAVQDVAPAAVPTDAAPDVSPNIVRDGERIVSFAGQFFIHTEKRLPQFDQGPVKAYAASELSDVSLATHFALICEPHLTPRSRSAGAFSSISSPNLVRLSGAGPLYWPPTRGEHYVFIYEAPLGKPLTPEGQFQGLGWKPELVQSAVVKPLINVLLDLRDSDVIHGNIRPSNMFPVGRDGTFDRTILGECLAAPPSYNQPAMFETIERAMCSPIGRGQPTIDDDLYALGVSLAVILRHRDPMEGFTEDEIIRYKIEQGSYIALTGKDRFSGDILELLRGLLNDDQKQRWNLEDVVGWLDGQRLTPKPGLKKIKAARPVYFQEERYFRPALLALDMMKNQADAAQMVESGNLEQWISRSLEDPAIAKRLESAVETSTELGRSVGYWDRLLCRVSIALDPEAPIRYKGLTLHPEGIGAALSEAMLTKKDLQPYVDLINQQTVLFWLSSQSQTSVDVGAIVSRFDGCRAFLRQNNIAYGLERCMYVLNPEGHCQSEKLKGYYVRNPEDMMQAFEKISQSSKHPELFIDRHVAAFLSVKDRQNIDPYLIELNADERFKKILGNIKTLASIQQRSRMGKFPGICQWISEILDPVYERFHDRELRVSMKAKVSQFAEYGDIAKIAALIDNGMTIQKDTEGYNQARQDYYKLRVDSAKLEGKMADPVQFNQGIGREIAALVSCLLAGITILFFVFMVLSKGTIF